jgi:hypothetical protein
VYLLSPANQEPIVGDVANERMLESIHRFATSSMPEDQPALDEVIERFLQAGIVSRHDCR